MEFKDFERGAYGCRGGTPAPVTGTLQQAVTAGQAGDGRQACSDFYTFFKPAEGRGNL
jgi:hypothetical protein